MAKKKDDIVYEGQLCLDLSTNTERYVVQSNALVLAKQTLKLNSAKVMRAIIMQIEKNDDDFKTYHVTIPELAKLIRVDKSNLYRSIHDITTDIMKNPVELKPNDYDVTGKTEKRYIQMPWVDVCGYDDEIGLLVKINPILKPYLLNLKGHYTQYPLEDVLAMKSVYSIRIYEMIQEETIMKFLPRNGAHVELSIDEIRRACNCEDKFERWSQFKEKVIEQAVSEINECTNYVVTYEPLKGDTGKQFVKIRFHINMFYH